MLNSYSNDPKENSGGIMAHPSSPTLDQTNNKTTTKNPDLAPSDGRGIAPLHVFATHRSLLWYPHFSGTAHPIFLEVILFCHS